MVKYDWEILKLIVAPSLNSFSNVVTKVSWRYQASEGGYFADRYFVTEISAPEEGNPFTLFDELTDEQVFSWISSNENIEDLKQALLEKLEKEKNPTSLEKEVPWSKKENYLPSDKFLIVIDGEINLASKVLGPIIWNSDSVNSFVKKFEIDYEFPSSGSMFSKGILPTENPLIIDERLTVYRCDRSQQQVDTTYQTVTGFSWDVSSGQAVMVHNVEDKELFVLKKDIIKDLKLVEKERLITNVNINEQIFLDETLYPDQIDSPFVSVNDRGYQVIDVNVNMTINEKLYSDIIGNLLEIGNRDAIVFCKVNDKDIIPANRELLSRILLVINSHYKKVDEWSINIYQDINNATTLEELKEIKISLSEI